MEVGWEDTWNRGSTRERLWDDYSGVHDGGQVHGSGKRGECGGKGYTPNPAQP